MYHDYNFVLLMIDTVSLPYLYRIIYIYIHKSSAFQSVIYNATIYGTE